MAEVTEAGLALSGETALAQAPRPASGTAPSARTPVFASP